MNVSQRAATIQASPIRKLMPYANKAKERGIKIYHLNIGQPDIETPQAMLDVYHKYNELVLAYGPSQGLDEYRTNLVRYYKEHNIDITKDDIIVTTAGSEAIVFALLVTCDEGDEIIIPEPFYTNYNGFAKMAGVKIVPVTSKIEEGFKLPPIEEFENKITDKTKAIMICNPNNPTGTVYSEEELYKIANIAEKHNLFVISDEVYREFVYDGKTHTSILNLEQISDNAIMVDSISKRYSACGARIGCIISKNKNLMSSVLKFAQARLCPPTIDQLAANAAIDVEKDYFKKILIEYDNRRNLVYEKLSEINGVTCFKPSGAFYIIAKLPVEDAEDFAIWMLNEFSVDNKTVMVAPAAGFYASENIGKDEVRFAYILNVNDLKDAMDIFAKGLKEYQRLHK
jgi:aspartate aminotransferase